MVGDILFPPVEGGDEEVFPPLEEDEDEEDFILYSSPAKAGARVSTMTSRSDRFDTDWTAGGTKRQSKECQTKLQRRQYYHKVILAILFVISGCIFSNVNICLFPSPFLSSAPRRLLPEGETPVLIPPSPAPPPSAPSTQVGTSGVLAPCLLGA